MTGIKHISDIDTTTTLGQLLVAAISLLSTESLIPKSYDAVIEDITELAGHMYGEPKEEEYTYSV